MVADFGALIKRLREERHLRPSDIEKVSRSIADHFRNHRFFISHSSLDNIEASRTIPSIFKIFSFSVCFRLPYVEVLAIFGLNLEAANRYAAALQPAGTMVDFGGVVENNKPLALEFDIQRTGKETTVLVGEPEEWGVMPVPLAQRLQPARFAYALIAMDDDSMGDIIPPGSLVEIDKEQNAIVQSMWRTLRERPIYFVWHERGYSCCWCSQNGNELTLVPHPLSRRSIMRFKLPREAAIIGRVVHAWLPFHSQADDESTSAGRSN